MGCNHSVPSPLAICELRTPKLA